MIMTMVMQDHAEENGPFGEQTEESKALPPYIPPAQFRALGAPPLLEEPLSENTELWLVRIQDNQLGAEDFRENRVTVSARPTDARLGCFESSKGTQFEILGLDETNGAAQAFAFLPRANTTSLDVCRISRHVAFVRSIDLSTSNSFPQHRNHISSPQNHDERPHEDDTYSTRSSSKKGSKAEHKQTSSVSTGVTAGGISTIESLKEHEERISTGFLTKSEKKSRKAHSLSTSELESSPQRKVDAKQALETSSEKKSHRHKKLKKETASEVQN